MSARKAAKPAKKSASVAKRPAPTKPAASPRLTVITLGVSDLARSRRFYCEGLGFSPSSASNDHIVFLDAGGVVLALYPRDLLAKDAQLSPKGSGFGGIALARNVRTKAEVDAALEAARKAGAKILKPAEQAFWGGYSGYFADPDDHPWEVAYNPHWKLDAEGRVVLPR
jgi:catechol 2,3-dioxygenase-like lactoylglutathione lyase family enzyme